MNAILAPSERDDGFPAPRNFQIDAHQALRQGFREGHRKQVIMAPTGAGKTYLGLQICNEAIKRGKRAVFLCDRTTLINQTSAVADRYGLNDHGIIQANHWRRAPHKLFQIASVQTIGKRKFWPQLDVLVVDECFPGDTLVSTTQGLVEIRNVRSGDLIYNSMGVGRVESVFSKPATNFVKVKTTDGTIFRCTPDHPVFTRMGWKPAGTLGIGEKLFRLQDLPMLRKEVLSKNGKISQWKSEGASRSSVFKATELWKVLCEEAEKSDEQRFQSRKDAEYVVEDRTQAENTRRQWSWDDICTEATSRLVGQWVDFGICGDNQKINKGRISASLQIGFGERKYEDCRGVGRHESHCEVKADTGSEKGFFASLTRVESIEIEESGSPEPVFNLRVAGHPSYFANGILVHNCHTTYKAWTDFVETTDAAVVGLSATPFTKGLGNIFSNLINATTMHDLTQAGILTPMRIFSCHKPDMTGAATAGGEWTDKAAEERGMEIIGDVIADWIHFGENRKTIVFGATIKHCEELCKQFISAGIMAAMFTSETTSTEREKLLEEYRKPNGYLKVLISVEALAKGFDVPDVGCICDARPLRKSLSTAIQMWGRGLRSSPDTGKKDCHLLDFSGNIVRFFEDFNEIYFNGLAALDDGEKLDKTIRKAEEFEKKGCPRCGYTPFHKRCMACGFEKVSTQVTKALPGQMSEIFIGEGKNKKKLADSAQHLWQQLCTYAKFFSKPEKQSARAWHLYRQITGQESKWAFSSTQQVEITKPVMNKIQSLNMAYRKSLGKRK